MSRHNLAIRHVGRFALLAVSSMILFGCSSDPVALGAEGVPSLSLNAPLTAVACTSSGTCIAVGASGELRAPTTAGQIRNHKGVWSPLNTPGALLATFTSASCATNICYFGGTKAGGELLWSVNANNGTIHSLAGPPGGLVIRDLSCTSDIACTVIDVAANHTVRLSHSTNAGSSWSAPRTLRWASENATTLNCSAASDCFVASSSLTHVVSLRHTLNGGLAWHLVTTPVTWRSLSSLQCVQVCTALVTTGAGSRVASQAVSLKWQETALTFQAASLSCASATLCVAVGQLGSQTPAMAQWVPHVARNITLTYVPSALNEVACQPAVCVAIGVTTVIALRP